MTSSAPSTTLIRRATTKDAALLSRLAATSFAETFADRNDPADMASYLASSFSEAIQFAELADSRNTVFLAERAGEAVGYAMLRDGDPADCVADPAAIEIARLYATKASIGTGVGGALMQRCLDDARARGHATVWLGVWEENARAIAFYHRWGFDVVGGQFFTLGRDRQTDKVMARRIAS